MESVSSLFFDTIRIKLDKYDDTNLYNAEIIFISDEDNINYLVDKVKNYKH